MKTRFPNFIWGIFLLLAAAFILVSQLDSFTNIGFGSIIVAFLSLAFIVQCIAYLWFSLLPVPIAVLYAIFQIPFNLPFIQIKFLILASVLASIGLAIILPRKHSKIKHYSKSADQQQPMRTESIDNDNNPSVSVNFGAISRRLYAESLESVQLYCNFGALEIFLDKAELSPKGATADINCSFGAVQLYVPKHWQIIDRLNCSLGGVNIDKNISASTENVQQLTLSGSVSLGGIDIKYI